MRKVTFGGNKKLSSTLKGYVLGLKEIVFWIKVPPFLSGTCNLDQVKNKHAIIHLTLAK